MNGVNVNKFLCYRQYFLFSFKNTEKLQLNLKLRKNVSLNYFELLLPFEEFLFDFNNDSLSNWIQHSDFRRDSFSDIRFEVKKNHEIISGRCLSYFDGKNVKFDQRNVTKRKSLMKS